jgi:hypothetical protein
MPISVSLERAREVKRHVADLFESFGKVVGAGIVSLDGGYGIKINLEEAPPPHVVIPDLVEGVPVKVEFVGPAKSFGL